ncbi:odorant receptor Or1-like [Copidosoma floridanum]|uniref:odorant receptor Or1-like n=1 Tax=Copidosoma floridanum TaxID=29053 RepID=UPI0006C9D520|nr:odorant receptor Or1-like [Copidosoma floridanum]
MDLLPVQFRALRYFGLWYEAPEEHRLPKMAYRVLVFLVIIQFTILQVKNIPDPRDLDIAVLSDVVFLLFLYFAHVFKLLVFVLKRASVLELLGELRSSICRPRDAYEATTLGKYKRRARNVYFYRMIVSTISCSIFFLVPIAKAGRPAFPIAATFFEVDGSAVRFALAYLLQVVAVYVTATTEVFLDSTVCAFVILANAQVDFYRHRLIVNGGFAQGPAGSVGRFVEHHLIIQSIVRRVQSTFMGIIVPVFCFGLITLCTSLFKFTQISTTLLDRAFCSFYLAYLLYPIYVYCWYGNELQEMNESIADTVYKSDWTALTASQRKSHWYVIFISQKKHEISYHGQCVLSLQTFIWMMKTSYGAFNLLQQVSGDK